MRLLRHTAGEGIYVLPPVERYGEQPFAPAIENDLGGIKKRRKNDGLFYIAIECRIGYRKTYGIAAIDREDGEKIILGAVVDVAENREKVEQLAECLNKEKVLLERFREAVEDFVG